MAGSSTPPQLPQGQKLPPIPKGSKISKRPLQRRAFPGRASTGASRPAAAAAGPDPKSARQHVYVSTRTPFMAAVAKVRKQLERAERAAHNNRGRGGGGQATKGLPLMARLDALSVRARAGGNAVAAAASGGNGVGEGGGGGGHVLGEGREVLVMGTGRAIEKTLLVAGWFNRRPEYAVSLRTSSIATVDDVVREESDEEGGEAAPEGKDGGADADADADVDMSDAEEAQSRVRFVNCVEVGVSLR